ncbi:hypothetical protein IPA_04270 [Ignicoccus pacificus DSM 13166]|uniref:Amidohydrolase-related domain-containing protein n=1 Tax=Ignicoccus pacificus DSM 13166 TaxID=940294 RepID=A0A977KB48_9CREN|nr:hypothetical protein IPA_04270 [Ignicoccus pacificus DSM 13166]
MSEEGYSVLISNATIVLEPGKYVKGYLYLNKGIIAALGEGEVPEEYSYAMYLIDGKNRIVTPGLICPLISISSYPSRFGGKEAESIEELYYAAQMAIQDLLLSGVTAIGTVEDVVDPIARAIANSGIRGVIFVDSSKEGWKKQLDILLNRWHGYENRIYAGIYDTEGNEEAVKIAKKYNLPIISPLDGFKIEEVSGMSKERGIIKISKDDIVSYGFTKGSKTTNPFNIMRTLYYMGQDPISVFKSFTVNAAGILGLKGVGKIKLGFYADIAIFDVSEPPGWTAGKGLPEEVLLATNPRVETVIVGGEVVVDSFQPLTIGSKDVRRARKLFGER